MSSIRASRLVGRFVADILIWLCAPSIFLFIYTIYYLAPTEAVLPHLRLVLVALSSLALTRIAIAQLIRSELWRRLIISVLASALLGTMLIYYGLVVLGLNAWKRVISWELITSYIEQSPQLADAVGISLWAGIVLLALIYLGLLAAILTYFKHVDWAGPLSRHMSTTFVMIILLTGYAIVAIEIAKFSTWSHAEQSEPMSLTLFPLDAAHQFQGAAVNKQRANYFARMDDRARASYKINPNADRKNVILIVVDALRPDHMGIYKYARDTTPHLDQLKKTGMSQQAASMHAACSESACGILSISSSKFVHQFSERPFTLQEALKRHGYRIEMILGGDHTNFYGLKTVYGEVDSYFDGSMVRGYYANDDHLVLDRATKLSRWNRIPTMLQFHLMSTHVLGKRHNYAIKFLPAVNYALWPNRGAGVPDERAVNYYDNGVTQADQVIHQLLGILQNKGYLNNAIVAITADHGESLGEHNIFRHAGSVTEELLRIPFLVISYGYRQRPFSEKHAYSSQVDIAPTLLAELGIPRPESWVGLPLQESRTNDYSYFQQRFEIGLIDHRDPNNRWKYWFNTQTGEKFAFNLSKDPKETSNFITQIPLHYSRAWTLQQMSLMQSATDNFHPDAGPEARFFK